MSWFASSVRPEGDCLKTDNPLFFLCLCLSVSLW
jgi:hypothetical protein